MRGHFSTSDVSAGERKDAWRSAVTDLCGGMFLTDFGPSDFRGEIDLQQFDDLRCIKIAQNAAVSWRTRREVAASSGEFMSLIVQVRGRSAMAQQGREAVLAPGEMTLIHGRWPCTFRYDGDNVQLALRLPAGLLGPRPVAEALFASRLGNRAGSIIPSVLHSVFADGQSYTPRQEATIREALVALLAGAVHQPGDAPAELSPRLRVIDGYILRNLASETLTPRTIAGAHGISVRHLHRLFAPTGRSVADRVRQGRLAICAAALADPAQLGRSITEIAYGWGFNDSAGFSRAFRGEYGQSPTQYRSLRTRPGPPSRSRYSA